MSKARILLLVVIAGLVVAFFALGLDDQISRDNLSNLSRQANELYAQYMILTIIAFFFIYVAVTGLSLPGAAIMTLLGGGIFGFWTGLVVISFASTIGATVAFLVSRFILQKSVQSKFGDKLKTVNQGIEREGAFYLFAMRLVPAIPFFVINLVMGLTPIKTWTFYWVSQVGMLAGTAVYVYAGVQIANNIEQGQILTPEIIIAFTLLGLFPLIAKKIVNRIKQKKIQRPVITPNRFKADRGILNKYKKPRHFDCNIIVIGAGSGGLVAAYIAAAVKAKVTLIEKNKMGGDCLNTGCVPSKALIRSAKFLHQVNNAQSLGFKSADVQYDFADIMQRVQRVIKTIEPHDSVERYTKLGVDVIQGEANIVSPWEVAVNGKRLTTRNIIVAAGARPFVPQIEGLEQIDYLTSDTVWQLHEQPKRLLVLGGGPIGCELTQAFNRLGSTVIQLQRGERLMPKEDPEFSQMVLEQFSKEGVDVRLNHEVARFEVKGGKNIAVCRHNSEQTEIEFDTLLLALGRQANTTGYGLEQLGVRLTSRNTIDVNEFMQTNVPTIWACGDVAGPLQFTHTAAHQAWFASVNSLFGAFKRFKVDYSVIPWATFTEPEVARVGLNEQEAKRLNIPYDVATYGIDDLDRAIADEAAYGLVKVLTVKGKDKILGVTIAGDHAGDLIAEYVAAMKHGFGLNKILSTIHIYPTLAEANKFAAGRWKQAHKPDKLLAWVAKFHRWRRGGKPHHGAVKPAEKTTQNT